MPYVDTKFAWSVKNVLEHCINTSETKNDAVKYTPQYQVVEHSTESCLSASHLAPSVRQYWCQVVRPITRKHHLNTAYSAHHLLTTTPNYISTWLFTTSESLHEGKFSRNIAHGHTHTCLWQIFFSVNSRQYRTARGSHVEWQWTFHFSPKLKAAPKAALDRWPKMNQDFFAETISTTIVSWSRYNTENTVQGYCLHSILSIAS